MQTADPDFVAATNVSKTAATPVTANFSVPLTSVADGFHFFSVRAKDANNKWSAVAIRPFLKKQL